MKDEQNKEGQLNIELDEKIAEGTYSNLQIINENMNILHWGLGDLIFIILNMSIKFFFGKIHF